RLEGEAVAFERGDREEHRAEKKWREQGRWGRNESGKQRHSENDEEAGGEDDAPKTRDDDARDCRDKKQDHRGPENDRLDVVLQPFEADAPPRQRERPRPSQVV